MVSGKIVRAASAAVWVGAAIAVSQGGPARAGVIFSDGPGGVQPDEQVLVPIGQSGQTIFGVTQQSGATVLFNDAVGDEVLTTTSLRGAPRIDSADGLFASLRVSLADGLFFTEFEANPLFATTGLSFVVGVLDSVTGMVDYEMFTSRNGNNFFGVTATEGTLFRFIDIVGPANGIAEVRQLRIGGITEGGAVTPPVPEPGTLALLGTGAVGLLLGAYRRRRGAAAAA